MDKFKKLTVKELAQYVEDNEKTIKEVSQLSDLPPLEPGNQWRFDLVGRDPDMQQTLLEASDSELDSIIKAKGSSMAFAHLTDATLIDPDFRADSKKQALSKLAKMAFLARAASSYEELYIELENRENLASTAIGNGVAIPHSRFPHRLLFREPKLVIARSVAGLDFGAPDGRKVHLFFLACAPTQYVHVRLMAIIAKLLHIPGMIGRLKNATKSEDILSLLFAV